MRNGRFVLIILGFGTAMIIGGCMAVVVGAGAAGTVAYVRGDLDAVESAGLDKVYKATKDAVAGLELSVISEVKDALTATIVARDAQDKKIKITLKSTAENTTAISLRVGVFGNETKSRLIYNRIRENLK